MDANNAFNSLNRGIAVRNALHLCPSLARVLVNTYRNPVNLYIDGEAIQSSEGTTQGDAFAMAMYALGITPLINHMSTTNSTKQVWYADDCTVCGSVDELRLFLTSVGPRCGYFPKPSKSWLSVLSTTPRTLSSSLISQSPRRVVLSLALRLGHKTVSADKVLSWVAELTTLSNISQSQPQAAYSALTHGLMGHWTYMYLSCTCPDVSTLIQPLGDTL